MSQPRIKILFVTPRLYVGGAERMLIDLITHLDKTRYEIGLVLFDQAEAVYEIWKEELIRQSITLHVINKPKRTNLFLVGGIMRALEIYCELKNIFKQEKPVIVQTQLFADFYGRLAAYHAGVPIILSVEQNINVGEAWYLYWMKRLTTPCLTRLITISQAIKAYSVKRYQVKPEKVSVIYSGVAVEKFLIDRKTIQKHEPVVLGAIGRLTKQKGFSVLIDALALLPDLKFTCLIAGEGELRTTLQAQIDRYDLTDKVELVGIQKDVRSFLGQLDFFVIPSLWEGLGIVALEAALAGLPMIASQVDGLEEIVDNEYGHLVPAGDAQALANKLAQLCQSTDSQEERVKVLALQKKVREQFSIEKSVAAYEALYQELLETQRYGRKN